ncbi:MAG: hypothetical protein ABW158_03870, partial [Candidatus Thiodiazotropha sp. 6PDIVS]
ASKRRCSTPTASFDNAVCRQAHFGLSLKNHIVRGFKPEDDILSRRVNSINILFFLNRISGSTDFRDLLPIYEQKKVRC